MKGQRVPDSDHVSRYCKPSAMEDGLPLVAAFLMRQGESYLSVNWLEYLRTRDLSSAVDMVRARFLKQSYGLKANGRFVVLNVGRCRSAALRIQRHLRIKHIPLKADDSHSGIYGMSEDGFSVATEMRALVCQDDVHPALHSQS